MIYWNQSHLIILEVTVIQSVVASMQPRVHQRWESRPRFIQLFAKYAVSVSGYRANLLFLASLNLFFFFFAQISDVQNSTSNLGKTSESWKRTFSSLDWRPKATFTSVKTNLWSNPITVLINCQNVSVFNLCIVFVGNTDFKAIKICTFKSRHITI